MANKIRRSSQELKEVDLTSFMNLMVVLIPILLASAEFAKIATIDISLPTDGGSSALVKETDKPIEEEVKLQLSVLVADSAMTIGGSSGFLPSIWYREFHKYTGIDTLVEYYPDSLNRETMEYTALPSLEDGTKLTIHEREDIFLVAYEDGFAGVKMGWYSLEGGELITDTEGKPVTKIEEGKDYWALTTRQSFAIAEKALRDGSAAEESAEAEGTESTEEDEEENTDIMTRRKVIGANPSEYEERQLSAYDLLKSTLVRIRERFPEAVDRNALTIAAENQIVYDKVIQIMDIGRSSNLAEISIAKLRR